MPDPEDPSSPASPASRRARRRERQRRRRRHQLFASGGALLVALAAVGAWQLRGSDGRGSAARSPSTSTSSTSSTTAPPKLAPPYSQAIKDENAKPGTGAWRLTHDGDPHDIEGYLDVTSAQRGDTVTLYATTVAPTFTIEAYRMGWYQGLGGRLVWTSPPVQGKVQAPATLIAATNTYEARWQPSTTFTITEDWPVGSYLLKLNASTGQQRWVPLTIRDDASTAAYVIENAVSSWQAYNRWGGCSLYACPGGHGDRSKMVSFDRPYDSVTDGSGDFVGNELPLIMRAEELDLDVTYLTSIDLHERPALLHAHKAMISLGHDEYWSKEMFDGAEQARDAGVNLAFLGANAVYRQVRFEASDLGADRHMVNYRSTADPIRRTDPSRTTVSFREAPVNRPEAQLIGEQYQCNPVRVDGIVTEAASWIWAGTGVTDGQHIEILVGSEYDQYIHGQGGPDNVEIVAHSPLTCHGRAGYSDVTYYTAPSGAGVFATGTNYWVSKLNPPEFPQSPYNPTIVKVTQNVLLAFGTGPAGRTHPSQPNWRGLPGTGG
ncbi:MAG: N,N-dimethylformamidase beta subunit family domain-containing protein [Acidimicrobiia bacterium]